MNTYTAKRTLRPVWLSLFMGLALAMAIMPGLALAHAEVKSSTPTAGSTVQPGLTQIVVMASEEISLEQSNGQLVGSSGASVPGVTSSVERADRKKLVISMPALAEGKYTVKLHFVTEDDNGITDPSLSFTVASAVAGTSSGAGVASPTSVAASGTGTAPAPLPVTGAGSTGLMWWLGLAAVCLLVGGALASLQARKARS